MAVPATDLETSEHDLKHLMADVTRAVEKAQRAVAAVTGKASEHSDSMPQERRSSPRQAVDHLIWIDVGDGSPVRPAIMWDKSEGGARLIISSQAQVPDKFSIIFASDHTMRRECRVVWRSEGKVGVTLNSG